jgi:hypothetical protein
MVPGKGDQGAAPCGSGPSFSPSRSCWHRPALGAQMETAVDAIRGAVLRLLREGEVHPQIIIMAAARVAGGLGKTYKLS